MLTSEQVVEYLIMIDLQRKGAEDKLNAEGLSTLLDLQSDKELKDVKMLDVLDYIHTQEEEIEELKTRVSELQDKDWYEKCIKQLEEQNDKLIKERDALQYKVSSEGIDNIPEPKFDIGSTVIAKTINCIVVIEDRYYDNSLNKWLYQFHAPSSVMDDDYYSTYSEDYLEEMREDHNDQ